MNYFTSISALVFFVLIFSCGRRKEPEPVLSDAQMRESLMNVNKELTDREADDIRNYLSRKKLTMRQTGTGLRYMFLKDQAGETARAGNRVSVRFTLSLLDGRICYSSDTSGPEEFLVDKDHVESGLHEGIKLMSPGDRAKFILPSHLAHGLLGDRNCIAARSPVVYDIELLDVK